MFTEAGGTTIRMPDYCAKVFPCRVLYGYDANSPFLWGMVHDMPFGPCKLRIVYPQGT